MTPAAGPVTTFHGRRWLLLVYFALGVAAMVQGIATAAYFLYFGEAEPPFFWLILGLAAALFGFGLWFAATARLRLRNPGPAIVIGPAGLHDRAISERPIPWSKLHNFSIWHGRGGPVVTFDLGDGAEDYGLRRPARASAAFSRQFAHNYHIHSMGTDASVDKLVEAITPYAEIRR